MTNRIIIAEDEPITALALRWQLAKAGYEVMDVVANGLKAIESSAANCPDVALLDIRMPCLDGIKAARAIMESNPTCIVMLSAQPALFEEAIAAGAMTCLEKPALLHTIERGIASGLERFSRYLCLLTLAPNPPEALRAWQSINAAARKIHKTEGIDEFAALDRLLQVNNLADALASAAQVLEAPPSP